MTNSINDMYLVAALIAYGGKLEKIDRTDKDRQKFFFSTQKFNVRYQDETGQIQSRTVTLEEAITLYSSKQLWLPPTYASFLKDVKSTIHQV